jgi:hypothetical protein
MSDTNLRPGVFDDTMPRRGIVKSNDLPHLEVVIADTIGTIKGLHNVRWAQTPGQALDILIPKDPTLLVCHVHYLRLGHGLCQMIRDLAHQTGTCESTGKVAEPSCRRSRQHDGGNSD